MRFFWTKLNINKSIKFFNFFTLLILCIFFENFTHAEITAEYIASGQREANDRSISRADNSDHKLTYYEKRLYPKQNFSSDTVLMRIERLEIALFGVISDEELLSERLLKIESEMALLELNSPQNTTKSENKQHEERRITELKQEREMIREANLRRENRRRNYSMVSPLIQGASQRLLRMI
jgi:hypothetical protein